LHVYDRPENSFQSFSVVREYGLLALATGFTVAWPSILKRAYLDRSERFRGYCWLAWNWCLFACSATTKHGIVWDLVSWQGNWQVWLWINCAAIAGMILAVSIWVLSLLQDPVEDWTGVWS
jgi:drug/metabolite transporter (DMT)-like permease